MRKWWLASGQEVIDRDVSHIHANVSTALLAEALSVVRVDDADRVKHTHDFGRTVGVSHCVQTQERDEIVFAQRVGRGGLSRFVKNREPVSTTMLTVSLKRVVAGRYEIRTAYLGDPGHVEPWAASPDRFQDAVAFWEKHALCYGYEPIVPSTETNACPWDTQEET